jgi:hypothetical protein
LLLSFEKLFFAVPPSYHEAMGSAVHLNEEGDHAMGSQPFRPMYPMYNFTDNLPTGPSAYLPHMGVQNNGFVNDLLVTQSTSTPGSISESAIIHKY